MNLSLLKRTRENNIFTYKGIPIRLINGCLSRKLTGQKIAELYLFRVLKGGKILPQINALPEKVVPQK